MLALLLHHHQPDYRDPRTGQPIMPWVRLHATRGYLDTAALIRETGAPVTLNLVPSLLEQLDHYAAGGTDDHLELARRPADSLSPAEARWVAANFFHGHSALYGWFPAYGRLRQRREVLDLQGLRDLQVWSNLAWFGFTALAREPLLRELRAKGAGFTEAEKLALLDVQARLLRGLRAEYQGLPDVSASPWFHPILPLLVDTGHAARCLPHPVDPGFRAPEDALEQLRTGRAKVEAWTGATVRGAWPSEGSVSPEVLPLLREAGFRWFATDEGILHRSTHDPGDAHGTWEVDGLRVLFRTREPSDRIGFVYGTWDGVAAARDLLDRVGTAPTFLALDGENPWEGYRDAGRAFLTTLFTSGRLRTASAMAEDPPRRIHALHTGSWIGADFRIWIGDEADVAAWRLLTAARAVWVDCGRPEAARRALYAAEGSDWFWWYGPEFETPFAEGFDRLFRAHLQAVYAACGRPAPPELDRPLSRARAQGHPPRAELGPGGWFAEAAAGVVELAGAAMAPGAGLPERLRYGASGAELRVWVTPATPGWSWCTPSGRSPLPAALPRAAVEGWLEGPGGLRLPAEGSWRLDPEPPAVPGRA